MLAGWMAGSLLPNLAGRHGPNRPMLAEHKQALNLVSPSARIDRIWAESRLPEQIFLATEGQGWAASEVAAIAGGSSAAHGEQLFDHFREACLSLSAIAGICISGAPGVTSSSETVQARERVTSSHVGVAACTPRSCGAARGADNGAPDVQQDPPGRGSRDEAGQPLGARDRGRQPGAERARPQGRQHCGSGLGGQALGRRQGGRRTWKWPAGGRRMMVCRHLHGELVPR